MEKSRKKYVGLKGVNVAIIIIMIFIITIIISKVVADNMSNKNLNNITSEYKEQPEENKIVTTPRVEGMSFEEAKRELEKYNLKIEKIEEKTTKVLKGYVLRQEPKYNTKIEENSIVKVYVSINK